MKAGWTTRCLSEVCTKITDGSHFSPSTVASGYPYITVRDIKGSQIDFANCAFVAKDAFLELQKNGCNPNFGDVLFSKDGTVGKVAMVETQTDFVVLSSLAILRPDARLMNAKYLSYVLRSPAFLEEAIGKKTGVAIRRIILKNLKQIPVSYPSLFEQQRIVTLLDEAFVGIATAKAHAEKNLQNARAIFESQLQSVFTQRGDGWVERTLGSTYDVRDGTHDSPKYYDKGFPLITSKNLKRDGLSFDDVRLIDAADYRKINEISAVHKGDVLLAMIGTIGNPVVVEMEPEFAIKNVALLKVPAEQNSHFLRYYLSSQFVVDKMQFEAKGTTQKFVGLGYLRSFPIMVPSVAEQASVVCSLDDLSTETNRLEEIYQQKLTALDELKKSLLHRAFNGDL